MVIERGFPLTGLHFYWGLDNGDSPWGIKIGLESGARNRRHRTNCDWVSIQLKRSGFFMGVD
jgi:hypothetical protein